MTDYEAMTTGKIREIIRLVEPDTEADPRGVLLAMLSQISSYVGDTLYLDDSGRIRPLIIDTLLIGPTNKGRKGTALAASTRVFNIASPDFLAQHEVSGAKTGAGIIGAFVKRRDAAKNAQIESLESGREYDGIDPGDTRMFLVEEEYASVLKSGKRDATLQGVMRKTWDGADLQNMTKDGGVIRKPVFVIHGHVSPTEFRHNLSSADVAGGSFNRLICGSVIRSKKLKKRHRIDQENLKMAGEILGEGLDFAKTLDTIALSDSAIDLFDDGLSDEIEGYGEGLPVVEAFVGRAEEYVCRIAAIYAVIDQRKEIKVLDVKAAWNLVKYCLQSITDILQGSEGSNESRIRAVLRKNPDGVTGTVLLKATGLNAAAIQDAVDEMADVQTIVVPAKGSKGGRPSTLYVLVEPSEGEDAADDGQAAVDDLDDAEDQEPENEAQTVPRQPKGVRSIVDGNGELRQDAGNDFANLLN